MNKAGIAIQKHYETLSTEQVIEQLCSGKIKKEAIDIGIESLRTRGLSEQELSEILLKAKEADKNEESRRRYLWLLIFIPLWLIYKLIKNYH